MTDAPQVFHFAGGAIRVSREEGIATLEINRPDQRNAVSGAMWSAFPQIAAELSADPEIAVLLLRGSGREAFSAGADLTELPTIYSDPERTRGYVNALTNAETAISNLPFPTIAVIYGFCVGGGCGLALACDLRFAAADACIGVPAAKIGLAYSFADTARLAKAVGTARAKDMLFSGRLLDAEEALGVGLFDFVVQAEALDATVADYAATIRRNSSASIQFAKTVVNAIADGVKESPTIRKRYVDTLTGPDFRDRQKAASERRQAARTESEPVATIVPPRKS